MNDNEQELAHRATEISFADALALGGPLAREDRARPPAASRRRK